MASPAWLLVGPPDSRRITALQQALHTSGQAPAPVIDYADVLRSPQIVHEAIARHPQALVKLESPGEDAQLHARLVQRGWQLRGAPGAPPSALQHGELSHQHDWHAGFNDLLCSLPAAANYLNTPAGLLATIDKLACQQRFVAAGVPVPTLFGTIDGHEDLIAQLQARRCSQVFIKARYGSSAAGVLAFRRHPDGRQLAIGTAELVREQGTVRVFNALRQRRYTDAADIAALVDALAVQGAYVEQWIPKPRVPGAAGRHYDIRVVTLDGHARQRVARTSEGPLTNLHLGNRRGALEDWLDHEAMARLEEIATRSATALPGNRMLGIDLVLRNGTGRVLEANGFGDLLPELRWHGATTWDDQAALTSLSTAAHERHCA